LIITVNINAHIFFAEPPILQEAGVIRPMRNTLRRLARPYPEEHKDIGLKR
jgi:hypothetical protein